MKKKVSPIVTVIVILVVVALVGLLWNHFVAPGRLAKDRMSMTKRIDTSKVTDWNAAVKDAEAAKERAENMMRGSKEREPQ